MSSQAPGSARRFILPGLFVLMLFVVLVARREPPTRVASLPHTAGETMGTTWTVRWVPTSSGEDGNHPVERVNQSVQAALDAVDGTMSTYKPDSELMRLNRHQGESPMEVSASLMDVLLEAKRIHEWSSGGFDVTVSPLVQAWGFGHQPDASPPDAAAITALRARVGQQHLALVSAGEGGATPHARRLREDVRVDLSALAKGYGVDRAADALIELGLENFMVEVGGEVRVVGTRQGTPWRIGVEVPDGGKQDVHVVVPLVDQALATSGDYRQVNWVDGKPISHTIDPRTGRPVAHQLASVSVVAETAMRADALATALMVLGPVEGHALAEDKGWPALFLVPRAEGEFEEKPTSQWKRILAGSRSPGAH